jgi:IMP dehydrogenase
MAADRETFFEDRHGSPFHEYLGYKQIQLRTERMSHVAWEDVDVSGQVSTNYRLRNPIITAAMNCIATPDMAIAMAKNGGVSYIDHANTPDEQRQMVKEVYHHLAGIITKPITAKEDSTLGDILTELDNRNKDFRTLPVVDENERCIGLVDGLTFKLFEPSTPVKDAMYAWGTFTTDDIASSPNQVYQRMQEEKTGRVVLLDRARKVGGLCLVNDIARVIDKDAQEYSLYENGRLMVFASVPTIPEEALERIKVLKKYVKVFGIDTSHGEHKYAVETLKAIKEEYSDIDILAGNISTEETAREIAKLEPDGMQVGQGPGGICISSDRLGFGTPQASAVYEVRKGAHSINPEIPIIADGGISEPADTMKAFACGATAVKVGGLVAGTDETPHHTLDRDEDTHAQFRWYWGMGSRRAQEAFASARARYGHFGPKRKLIFIEGFERKVPIKGPVSTVIEEHVMGLKLSMAAQGFGDQADIHENARFMTGSNAKN